MNLREKEDQRVTAGLRAVGINVNSIYDLVNSRRSYRDAIPTLIQLLPTTQDDRIKEGIVRALSVKEAVREDIAQAMIHEFEAINPSASPSKQALKWAIANTLSVVARDSSFERVAALARDARHGKAREMLVEALANMKNPEAVDVLMELLDDEEVAGHAVIALGKLKAARAKPAIECFLNHPKLWVRREAEKTLSRIRKAN